mmetsp:Transcript_16691/g.49935  ORF Transcript_16691/g.49935 Transcript_16691/m.49935 type:complete len:202 (-) Transcript_16691:2-607(-)
MLLPRLPVLVANSATEIAISKMDSRRSTSAPQAAARLWRKAGCRQSAQRSQQAHSPKRSAPARPRVRSCLNCQLARRRERRAARRAIAASSRALGGTRRPCREEELVSRPPCARLDEVYDDAPSAVGTETEELCSISNSWVSEEETEVVSGSEGSESSRSSRDTLIEHETPNELVARTAQNSSCTKRNKCLQGEEVWSCVV